MKILFVCTGNTCRSPMAEAIFNKFSDDGSDCHTAFSRGTNVMLSQPVNSKALEALENIGINHNGYCSRQLTADDIKQSDLILTMTSMQKMMLKNAFPGYKSKIFSLNEKAYGRDSDIADPYGMEQETYNSCCKEIAEAIKALLCTI